MEGEGRDGSGGKRGGGGEREEEMISLELQQLHKISNLLPASRKLGVRTPILAGKCQVSGANCGGRKELGVGIVGCGSELNYWTSRA